MNKALAVKLGPWLQFVGFMLFFGALLLYLRGIDFGQIFGYIALAVSVVGFVIARLQSQKPTSDAVLRFTLQLVGYVLASVGDAILGLNLTIALILGYVGVGTNFAGLFYDTLYP